jgi:hypothetical protein
MNHEKPNYRSENSAVARCGAVQPQSHPEKSAASSKLSAAPRVGAVRIFDGTSADFPSQIEK